MSIAPYSWRRSRTNRGVRQAPGFTIDHVTITGVLTGPLGSSSQLTATVFDTHGAVLPGIPVQWRSQDPYFVSVSVTGLLTFNALGSVVIVATVDGRDYSVTATATAPAGNQDFWGDRFFGRQYFGNRYFG